MSDIYGTGSAIRALFQIWSNTTRGTGRTKHMVSQLQGGDVVVFKQSQEGDRVRRLCREAGFDIEVRVVDPGRPYEVYEKVQALRGVGGRVLFDHTWVEEYYREMIEGAQKSLADLSRILNERSERPQPESKEFMGFLDRQIRL